MNISFKQQDRLGSLSSVLGKDVLNLLRFTGTDHVNGLFDYTVEALSTDPNIDFDAILGTHATVTIQTDHGPRHFDGIVTEARWAGAGDNGNRYNLILKPWFWLAGRRRNQRIFHEQTVVQIIEKLLAPYAALGNPALKVDLTNSYPTLEYTVQYRESDMAFAMRLMERFGISYHFTHDTDSHTMVLTDSMVSHSPLPGSTRLYKPHDGTDMVHEEHIRAWHADRRLTTGAMRLTDYNFKTPQAAMEVDRVGDATYAEGQIESYDYPGDYLDQGQGKGVVGLRTEQERGQDHRQQALGDCVSLGAGMLISLNGNDAPKERYLCLSATHAFTSESYGTGGDVSTDHGYTGSYVLMPDSAPLAPERTTHIPTVQGPQTAVVVGKGEIDCDEYGRILVHFHWDLEKQYSMRCRVSQNWASKGWGGMVIPRIGMEVVVEFLEGDPDKPLVIGCVYNGKNDVPYPLPEHKTKSVFRSNSHRSSGFNEFTFEDATGAESISLHAQKDQTLKVLNNRMKRIDNNQAESVGGNKSIEVGGNHQEKISGSQNISVGSATGGALFMALGGLLSSAASKMGEGAGLVGNPVVSTFVGGLSSASVMAEAASIGKNSAFSSAGGHKAIAGAAQAGTGAALGKLLSSVMPVSGISSTIVEKAVSETVGLAKTEQIGLLKNTVVGAVSTTYVGKKKIIDVGEELEIRVGKSRLTMKSDGTVRLLGDNFNVTMENEVQIFGNPIDLN